MDLDDLKTRLAEQDAKLDQVLRLNTTAASNRYADRVDRSPMLKRLMDDFAGRSLTKALSSLDSIVRFEAEP